MSIQIALLILGRNAIKRIAHIGPDIRVPILIQGQSAASMLHEQIQEADLIRSDLGQLVRDMVGNEIRSPRLGRQRNRLLEPGSHCRGS